MESNQAYSQNQRPNWIQLQNCNYLPPKSEWSEIGCWDQQSGETVVVQGSGIAPFQGVKLGPTATCKISFSRVQNKKNYAWEARYNQKIKIIIF